VPNPHARTAVRALRIGFPPRDTRSKFPSCCRRASTVAIRQRVVSSVRDERTQMPAGRPVAMVPHSNAGLLIPAIGSGRVRHTLPAKLSTLTHPIPASPRTHVPHQKDCRHASLPLSRDGRWIPRFAELTSLARKAEAVGCSTFVLPDHLIGQYAAIPLLAVVAAASERLRVGTFVLNACLRHPAAGRRSSPAIRAPRRAAAPTASVNRQASS
jgi:hypothetical protein